MNKYTVYTIKMNKSSLQPRLEKGRGLWYDIKGFEIALFYNRLVFNHEDQSVKL